MLYGKVLGKLKLKKFEPFSFWGLSNFKNTIKKPLTSGAAYFYILHFKFSNYQLPIVNCQLKIRRLVFFRNRSADKFPQLLIGFFKIRFA